MRPWHRDPLRERVARWLVLGVFGAGLLAWALVVAVLTAVAAAAGYEAAGSALTALRRMGR